MKSVDAVRKTLSNLPPTKSWLLILDNADDPGRDYQMYIPSGNRGAILMTSRNPRCGSLVTADDHEELDSLEEPECIQLLLKTAKLSEVANDTEDNASAVSLVKHLGHHTLAILHAGSYIATACSSAADYLDFLRTNRRRLLQKATKQGKSRYGTVCATFGASIEFLERPGTGGSEETRKDSLELLKVLSTFHHMTVPLDVLVDAWKGARNALTTPDEVEMDSNVLTKWHVEQVPDLVRNEHKDVRFRITEAVTLLESLALVRTDRAARAWKSVSMHPLVHGWAGECQSQQERKMALRMTECIVALSSFEVAGWRPYHYQLAPHLKLLVESDVELVDNAVEDRCVLQACVQIARIYDGTGLDKDNYQLTGRIFQRMGLYDKEPTEELRGLYAVFAEAVGRKESPNTLRIRILQAILRLDDDTCCANHPLRIENMRRLGESYFASAQTKEAVALMERVVKARQQLGEEHNNLLAAQHELASALLDNGQTKEAITLIERVVRIRQRSLQEDNPNRLASQQLLAVAYLKDGQIREGTLQLEKVARIEAQSLGEEHPDTLVMQDWLADAYRRAGRLSEAIALYERAVNTRALVYFERYPDLLTSQHNLACAYLDAGRIQEAIDVLERVVDIRKSTLQEKDPALLRSEQELACAYLDAGRIQEAINILEQVVEVHSLLYDQGHPTRVVSQELLHDACAIREDSSSSFTPFSASGSTQPGSAVLPQRAGTVAEINSGSSFEAEGKSGEGSRHRLEGMSSSGLVLRDRFGLPRSLRARFSRFLSTGSTTRLRNVKGNKARRNQ